MPSLALEPLAASNHSLVESTNHDSQLAIKKGNNRLAFEDRGVHDWYRFVLSFPPHLVRSYLTRFGIGPGQMVLDPFCGTGTTTVECKKLGISSRGIEANIMAHFAGAVKTNWGIEGEDLLKDASKIAEQATSLLSRSESNQSLSMRTLSPEIEKLLLSGSISPLPLHKTVVLLDCIESSASVPSKDHLKLALAKGLVGPIGNLHFGPEVGVSKPKQDADVIGMWLENVQLMANDLSHFHHLQHIPASVFHSDSRELTELIPSNSIDAVITSPPYPNEKDYTRTTRLESVLLGFLSSKEELRTLKKGLLRSNTRNVYKGDDDDQWVAHHPEIQRIANAIEERRLELGKTSGFEKLYPKVTKLYFGGMARHLEGLKRVLRPGAQLAYVVGDQASYLRVMIRTGQILAEVAADLGYEVVGIDLFRTRLSTITKEQLREEVVILKWPGGKVH